MIAGIIIGAFCLMAILAFIFYPTRNEMPLHIGPRTPRANDAPGSLDKYTQRLLDEWEQHGKIIIGVDVDDTILPYRTSTQKECDDIINLVKDCQSVGAYVIIFTCRNDDGLEEVRKYCDSKHLKIDAINTNPPGVSLPYGNKAKPYANIFLDDRGHLQATADRLRECMYRMRSIQHTQRHNYPGALG